MELLLDRAARRHVDHGGAHAAVLPLAVHDAAGVDDRPERAAVLPLQAPLAVLAALGVADEVRRHRLPDHLLDRVAEHRGQALVGEGRLLAVVDDPHAFLGRFDDLAVELLVVSRSAARLGASCVVAERLFPILRGSHGV